MADLLLTEGLRSSDPQSEVRDLARARTLTALRRLDGPRKGLLVRFLREAKLSQVNLANAQLRGAVLWFADLKGANLKEADLTGAQLWFADLQSADLTRANLSGAEFTGANLSDANLTWANLNLADLEGSILNRTNLKDSVVTPAQLTRARSLSGAIGQSGARYE
jgi:uncharacterized protein YjbI with pentapeptide repeats